ncbi:hypothetical protein Avbf_14000 [Armadillidium vulgare]|nr:hypothetical protein Avbf_14000 [Armadillidium vulgare]
MKFLSLYRKRQQRWILYERESPPNSSEHPQGLEGVFNWTMTYRRDSDIVSGYGETYKKEDFDFEDFSPFETSSLFLDSVMKPKNKMAAWLVSNCFTPSNRGEYVQMLQKYIQVK